MLGLLSVWIITDIFYLQYVQNKFRVKEMTVKIIKHLCVNCDDMEAFRLLYKLIFSFFRVF